MAGFTRLQVSGYRRLRNLDLALGPMNVLIGANGVGKSSVLEVMFLLGLSVNGLLETNITQHGGLPSLLTQDGRTDTLRVMLEMAAPAGEPPIRYETRIAGAGIGYVIAQEQLAQLPPSSTGKPLQFIDARPGQVRSYLDGRMQTTGPARPFQLYRELETALSQVPVSHKYHAAFRETLRDSPFIYHALDTSMRAPIRLPQPLQPARVPGTEASLLLPCLYTMRETERNRFDAVEDALRAAFPAFDHLDLPPAAAGNLTMAWNDRSLTRPLYPHQLSEGTLRFLWLATLLQSPGLPPVTLIDEPEVSLHPEMLRLLVDLMREASARTQLIVATHSDRLVRFLTPDELVVCDLAEDGGMTATRGDTLDLDEWLKDYTLDQLWSMGQIGGRS